MSKWIHTGGGWYENEETKERIRGKKNLPQDEAPFTTAVEVKEVEETELVCMACHKVTAHTQQPLNSLEWAVYNCKECGGKTRVSLR